MLVTRYERRRDEKGQRRKLPDDIKLSSFETLLPKELEDHILYNKNRLKTYEECEEEIVQILELKLGESIGETGTNDINAFGDPGACFNCGSLDHRQAECPRPKGKGKFGKSKGKGRGGKGYGRGGASKGKGYGNFKGGKSKGKGGKKGSGGKGGKSYGKGGKFGKSGNSGKGKGKGKGGKFGKGKFKGGKGKGKSMNSLDEWYQEDAWQTQEWNSWEDTSLNQFIHEDRWDPRDMGGYLHEAEDWIFEIGMMEEAEDDAAKEELPDFGDVDEDEHQKALEYRRAKEAAKAAESEEEKPEPSACDLLLQKNSPQVKKVRFAEGGDEKPEDEEQEETSRTETRTWKQKGRKIAEKEEGERIWKSTSSGLKREDLLKQEKSGKAPMQSNLGKISKPKPKSQKKILPDIGEGIPFEELRIQRSNPEEDSQLGGPEESREERQDAWRGSPTWRRIPGTQCVEERICEAYAQRIGWTDRTSAGRWNDVPKLCDQTQRGNGSGEEKD